MTIVFNCFNQPGTNKPHIEDALLLNCQVHQVSVRERGEADTAKARYFAVTDSVAIGTRPRTVSRRLLELL